MHVMKYCCIIVTQVLHCAFYNIALFHCRDYFVVYLSHVVNIGVNAAKIAKTQGSTSNKLVVITMILGSYIARACSGDILKRKL